jgi:hypothetical protein
MVGLQLAAPTSLHRVSDTRDSAAAAMTPEAPPSLLDAVGGRLGVAESAVPAAAFVITYTVSGQDTRAAVIAAIALGVIFAVARIVRGQTVQYALAGLGGLALSAYVVSRTGKAEDFFLPGLLANAAYASAFVISIAVRRPLVGLIVSQLDAAGAGWREDPDRLRAFTRASWLWAGLFVLRLIVQLPLYLAGAVVALGIARTAMGLPLFALALWLTWRLVRRPHAAAAAT